VNKLNLFFKIFSISMLAVNSSFIAFFIPAVVKVLNKTCIFSKTHLVVLICVLIFNILYFGFITFMLIKNNLIKKQKLKNINK